MVMFVCEWVIYYDVVSWHCFCLLFLCGHVILFFIYLFFPFVYVCDLMVFDGVESFPMGTMVMINIVLFAMVFVDFFLFLFMFAFKCVTC